MNSELHSKQSLLTLPNLLTGFRFVAAPGLLWLAWQGYGIAFMILLSALLHLNYIVLFTYLRGAQAEMRLVSSLARESSARGEVLSELSCLKECHK